MVCSGTVFNKILVWRPSDPCVDDSGTIEPLDYLEGHDGVIFEMQYQKETGVSGMQA